MAQGLQEGTLLHHGRYRIIRILGQGGFGITYLAFDTERNYYVAIKEYFPSTLCNREGSTNSIQTTHENNLDLVQKGKNRFIKEARNLHHLNNSEIVKVYAAFEENRTAYYVMEYIDGVSLYHYVQERGPLNEKEALNFIIKIAKAVAFIHVNNFTHYDLKPQNIMIRDINNNPVLIDFGLSKQFDEEGEATSTMMYAHSEGYSPIELYNREMGMNSFSPQTDIYSLGAILFFLLTGSKPSSAPYLLEKGLTIPNHISPQMAFAIKKAMALFRINRFQTVEEFLRSISPTQNQTLDIGLGEDKTIIETPESQTTSVADKSTNNYDDYEEKKNIGKLLYIGGGVIAIGIILLIIFYFNSSPSKTNNQEDEPVVEVTESDFLEESLPTVSAHNLEVINGIQILWNDNITDSQKKVITNLLQNMVLIDGGHYLMGSDKRGASLNEKPVHQEDIKSFRLNKFETTQKLWKEIMGNNPSIYKGENLPVENISWYDCQEFIKRLNELTGLRFRLPTEAEWEYAARGGNKSKYDFYYSGSDNINSVGWYEDNSNKKTHPVGQKKSNDLGIFDMSGNVWEWTSDYLSEDYSSPRNYKEIVCRGGSWRHFDVLSSVSARSGGSPQDHDDTLGFRLAI